MADMKIGIVSAGRKFTTKRIIMLEVGVLLNKDHDEYEAYSDAYDKKHGFYDESQEFFYKSEYDKVKETGLKYVRNGIEGTYAVITDQGVAAGSPKTLDCGDADYALENVIYSVAKIDGQIVESFINKESMEIKEYED